MPPAPALDLSIAGIRLRFHPPPGLTLAAPGFQYGPFLDARTAARTVDIPVSVHAPDYRPAGRVLFDTGDGWRLWEAEGTRTAEMPDRRLPGAPGAPVWRVTWRPPLETAEASVSPALVSANRVQHLVHYPLDQILCCEALMASGGLLLHAAGGVTPRGGVAFAGPSGAGKSTVTRLLSPRAGYRFLSDDRLFLCPEDGGLRAFGTPWCGDADVAEPGSTRILALCFLHQSAHTALTPLAPRDALERLLPVVTLPWYDRDRISGLLAACAALVTACPCFQLAFTPDGAAVDAALTALADAA